MNREKELELLYEQQVNEMTYGLGMGATAVPLQTVINRIKAVENTGSIPISVTVVGWYKPKKRANPGVDVYKVSQMNGMIDADYEKSVNRQREREGKVADFERRPSKYDYVSPAFRSLKSDPSKIYLAIQPTPGMKGKSQYVAVDQTSGNTQVISLDQAMEWAYVTKYNPQATAQSQGLEKQREYRIIKLENIAGVTIKGDELMVDTLTPGQQAALQATGYIGQ